MEFIPASDLRAYPRMNTDELRRSFWIGGLFVPGRVVLNYWETDRTVVGGAVPTQTSLALEVTKELASAYFCERRELGIVNIGGPGSVTVDGQAYELAPLSCLYVGRGSKEVRFASADAAKPAQYYLLSYPAHTAYPTTLAPYSEANGVNLGAPETANARVLHKLIHTAGIKSCQLVLGYTILKPGSVWNTMPPHTHLRRSEVYLYFNIPADAALFHFMGQPQETRHLLVHDREAVLSPSWSIHSGAGTGNYAFIWGMGGENQEFADMDAAPIATLR